ncbi:MAG: biotin-dependent carboxyltransferase family protein [Lachnospiraceae bacterium]|nr:biotin-dependent carboxyltransferase family protein [Lachnospiraceae bacterium]
MGMLFQKSGLLTTVQDLGRTGYQKDGFSVSGVMDRRSAIIANMLVDNPENEAVLEFMLVGPTIKFTSSTIIAITGGNFEPMINGKPAPMYTAIYANRGDVLELKFAKTGIWGYLSFSSKLDVPVVMGSRSTNIKCKIGGNHGQKIEKGEQVWFRIKKRYITSFLSRTIEPEDFSQKKKTIRVVLGPQDDYFQKKGIETFFSEDYLITEESDRMGYRLDGPYVAHKDGADIISDGIPLGAIQIPSHGKPIVMLADRQTTGGYAKIGTVISVDIPAFVQSKEGTAIHFEKVSVETAQRLYMEQEKDYDAIRKRIHRPCKEVIEPRLTAKRIEKLYTKQELQEDETWI